MSSELPYGWGMTTEPLGEAPPTQPVPGHEPARPTMIGPYRVMQQIGSGGMGVVHLALDPHGKAVALKVLRPHVADDEQARQRLGREVSTLRRVRSTRVAAVLDADVEAQQPYIVTRYVPGPSLDRVIERDGPMSPESLLRLARGLAEALHDCHATGVVHRDVKPGNVLMLDDEPVLIDFGIAHLADDSRLTQTGLVMGTPGYLAPETLEGAQVLPGTDWWGWASTLAFAASGRPPFGRGPMEAVISRVVRGEADLDGVDPPLVPLLAAALSPRIDERPTDREVIRALERYATGRPVTEVLRQVPATSVVAGQTQAHRLPETKALPVVPTNGESRGDSVDQPMPYTALPNPHLRSAQPVAAQPPRPATAPQPYAQPYPVPPPQHLQPQPQQPQPWPGVVPGRGAGDPRVSKPRRTGLLMALLALFTAGMATMPALTALLAVSWSWLARVIDRSYTGLVMRRHQFGRRGSDVPTMVAALPWRIIAAAGETLLSLILPVIVGAAAMLSTALGEAAIAGTSPNLWSAAPLGVGGALAGLMAWWGIGGASLRRGSRSMVRAVTPNAAMAGVVGILVLAVAVVIAFGTLIDPALSWWPLSSNPFPQVTQ